MLRGWKNGPPKDNHEFSGLTKQLGAIVLQSPRHRLVRRVGRTTWTIDDPRLRVDIAPKRPRVGPGKVLDKS